MGLIKNLQLNLIFFRERIADLFCDNLDFTLEHCLEDNRLNLLKGHAFTIKGFDKRNSVKLALGCALTAADAHVIVYYCGTAAKAALGLFLHLLLGKCNTVILEGPAALVVVTRCLTRCVVILANDKIVLIK